MARVSILLSLVSYLTFYSDLLANGLSYKNTQLLIVSVEEIDLVPHFKARAYGPYWGGAISSNNGTIFVVNASGDFLRVDRNTRTVHALPVKYDNNRDAFTNAIYATGVARYWPNNFRFTGLLSPNDDTGVSLIASTLHWHQDRQCFALRLIRVALPADLTSAVNTSDWDVLFESTPCLRLDTLGAYFIGQESGGRIARSSRGRLLLTVGHLGYDGRERRPNHPQDPAASYGKILQVDPSTGRATVISKGHRNPQGLLIAKNGVIWSTEHGPEGGDELNKIARGANYGWPNETLGVDYGKKSWELAARVGRHDTTTMPFFAWLPSIGVSDLIEVRGFDPKWDGDLLVGSLRGNSLFRLRLTADRVVYAEPIYFGERIRDLEQLESGEIVVLLDNGKLLIIRPTNLNINDLAPQPNNEALSSIIGGCKVCHSFARGMDTTVAPGLWGIVGRKIAGTKFPYYSAGLKRRGGVWDEKTLDEMLENPTKYLPDSPMAVVPGVSDPILRRALIEHLAALRD